MTFHCNHSPIISKKCSKDRLKVNDFLLTFAIWWWDIVIWCSLSRQLSHLDTRLAQRHPDMTNISSLLYIIHMLCFWCHWFYLCQAWQVEIHCFQSKSKFNIYQWISVCQAITWLWWNYYANSKHNFNVFFIIFRYLLLCEQLVTELRPS